MCFFYIFTRLVTICNIATIKNSYVSTVTWRAEISLTMQQPVSVRKKRWYHSQISNQPVPSPMLPQFVNGAGGTGHPQSLVRENDMKPDPGLEASPTLTTPCLDCKTSDAHKSASALARKMKLPETLQWIPENWTWSKIKPVIRCAVAAWIATVLFVIPRVQIFLGQVRDYITSDINYRLNFRGHRPAS